MTSQARLDFNFKNFKHSMMMPLAALVPPDEGELGEACCLCGIRNQHPVIHCGCGCPGAKAHVGCCVKQATKDPSCWWRCAACECPFQSEMELALLEERWSRVTNLPDGHKTRLSVASALGACLVDHGRYSEAEAIQRELFSVRKRLHGEEHSYTLTAAGSLASTLMLQHKHSEAEVLQRAMLTVMKRAHILDHPYLISTSARFATALSLQGKHAEAEKVKRELLAANKKLKGHEHPDTLAVAQDLALSLADQGKHVEAEDMRREVLLAQKRVLGVGHPDTMLTARVLASTLSRQGKALEAEAIRREMLVAEKLLHGPACAQASRQWWPWAASGTLVLAIGLLMLRQRVGQLRFTT